MTKKLNTDRIQSELRDSVFFSEKPTPPPAPPNGEGEGAAALLDSPGAGKHEDAQAGKHAGEQARKAASKRASSRASVLARELAPSPVSTVQRIRAAVKTFGKEVAYTRLTQEEKAKLARIVFGYRERGIRTTENEVIRIAVNLLLTEHEENGEESVLSKVLEALRA